MLEMTKKISMKAYLNEMERSIRIQDRQDIQNLIHISKEYRIPDRNKQMTMLKIFVLHFYPSLLLKKLKRTNHAFLFLCFVTSTCHCIPCSQSAFEFVLQSNYQAQLCR